MLTLQRVFSYIKSSCGDNGIYVGDDIVSEISQGAVIPPEKVPGVLETLKGAKIINYSIAMRYIELTQMGKEKTELFGT